LVSATTALKLIPLAVFVVAGATAVRGARLEEVAPTGSGGVGRAVLLALFAFMGMESALGASGEVARPSRSIPRALAGAMVTVTLLFVGVQVVAQGILGASLAGSSAPLADAIGRVHPALRALVLAGTA